MATNDASYLASQIKSNGLVVLENLINEEYCDKYKKILDDILSSRIDSDSFCGNNVKIIRQLLHFNCTPLDHNERMATLKRVGL